MHEHALMTGPHAPGRATIAARREGAAGRSSVSVWLGALSHMSPGHFARAFRRDAAAGSLAEGAALECVTSDDIPDPHATDVVLKGVEVET